MNQEHVAHDPAGQAGLHHGAHGPAGEQQQIALFAQIAAELLQGEPLLPGLLPAVQPFGAPPGQGHTEHGARRHCSDGKEYAAPGDPQQQGLHQQGGQQAAHAEQAVEQAQILGAVMGVKVDHAGVDVAVQPAAAHPQQHDGGEEHGEGGGRAGEKQHRHLQQSGQEQHEQLLRPPLEQGVDQQSQHIAHAEHAAQQALGSAGQGEGGHHLVEQHTADGVDKGVEKGGDQDRGGDALDGWRIGAVFQKWGADG